LLAQCSITVSRQFPILAFSFPFWQEETPMFIVFTADDAVQSYTLDAVNQFLARRQNPNGCQPKMTYYVSLNYTNYTLVTDWSVAGNEIADHTSVTSIHLHLTCPNSLFF
jgi:hypothetical protein